MSTNHLFNSVGHSVHKVGPVGHADGAKTHGAAISENVSGAALQMNRYAVLNQEEFL